MSSKQSIQMRDARDRLSEVLQLGQPFPLRDLPVPVEGLTVPFNGAATIPVELSQAGVLYQLHDPREKLVERSNEEGNKVPVQAEGTGDVIYLKTPPITDDISYKILATKIVNQKETYLHALATVKVGLDTSLSAFISNHPALDATADSLLNSDPRLCDYADTLEVTLPMSQEGVDYRLVHFVKVGSQIEEVELSETDVRGTDKLIVLRSKAVMEDTTVRIRATKIFEAAENRENQTDLLNIELPIAVKANLALDVRLAAAIVDYASGAVLHINNSQASTQYRLYTHRVLDPEIVHEPASDAEVLRVKLPQEPEVQVRRPLVPDHWEAMVGYAPATDFHSGNGAELIVPLDSVTEDSVLMVEAMKVHQFKGTIKISVSAWLSQPILLLARPNPNPDLRLVMKMQGDKTDGRLQLEAGQAGVFYFLRTATNGGELPQAAYVHQRDDEASFINKGLEQLEVGIDLVVAADPTVQQLAAQPDHARRAPVPPILESGPLAVGSKLYARAVKAQTRIEAKLSHTATIAAMPQVRLAQSGVSAGETATIEIIASLAGDSYTLMLNGEAVKAAVAGNGGDLSIESAAIVKDSEFQLWATRPDDSGIAVHRVAPLTVLLKPDSSLVVSALATEVEQGGATQILIKSSQPQVDYQLLVDGKALGDAVPGNGEDISLPTGPLTVDTTFAVRAARRVDATVTVELAQQVTLAVQPAAI